MVAASKLVVGLDYGTTFSGLAFCEVSNTDNREPNMQVIHTWPGGIGTNEKVPSTLAYVPNGALWGYQVPATMPHHAWTKLDLDPPNTGLDTKNRRELSSSASGGVTGIKSPQDIATDYIAELLNHLMHVLDGQYGKKLWRQLPITLVITVPAVWSDAAKDRTLRAVSNAGFNNTELPQLKHTLTVTEPEAAAIYTMNSQQGSIKSELVAVNDGIMVCDMGGGTVDLISYLRNGKDLEEITRGSGDQCGCIYVDRGFLEWLQGRLGIEDFVKIAGWPAKDLPHTSLSKAMVRLVRDFAQEIKCNFDGEDCKYLLSLPGQLCDLTNEERNISGGEIQISKYDLMEMFQFSVRRTRELLEEQLQMAGRSGKAKIKYIFLVGGFSESPYMYRQICAFAQGYGIEVIRPDYAWTAVVRGAVAKGLERGWNTAVKIRKCRRHYGIRYSPVFQVGKHYESESFINVFTGIKRARNQVAWLIKKDQDLSTSDSSHAKIIQ